jgi:hypothetical protein
MVVVNNAPPDAGMDSTSPFAKIDSSQMNELHSSRSRDVERSVAELVLEPRLRIALDHLVADSVAAVCAELDTQRFSTNEPNLNAATVQERLDAFSAVSDGVVGAAALLARWGDPCHLPSLQRIIRMLGDQASTGTGYSQWIHLRWVPTMTAYYAAGIAAMAGGRWEAVASLHSTRRGVRQSMEESPTIVRHAITTMASGWGEPFKILPQYERHHAAFSDWMFDRVRPILARVIHLGGEYEDLFDRFEVIQALTIAAARPERQSIWGPPGRFAWKHHGGGANTPFLEMEQEAANSGPRWAPVAAGMFNGRIDEFMTIGKRYREGFLNQLRWY